MPTPNNYSTAPMDSIEVVADPKLVGILSVTACIVSIVFLGGSILDAILFFREEGCYESSGTHPSTTSNSRNIGKKRRIAVMAYASLLFFTTVVCFAYGNKVWRRSWFEYFGPMRIVGTSYEYQTKGDCNRRLKRYRGSHGSTSSPCEHYIQPKLNLSWGYEWACSDKNISCESILPAPLCITEIKECHDEDSCSEEKISQTTQVATVCAQEVYFNETKAGTEYTPYEPNVMPSQDVDWPNFRAYGDCDKCEVRLEGSEEENVASVTSIRRLRIASVVFLSSSFLAGVGLVAYITFGAANLPSYGLFGKRHQVDKMGS